VRYKFQMGMTGLLNKRDEIVLHPSCIVLGDTEIFFHDKYRENVLRYSIYRRLSRYYSLANQLNFKVFDEICSEIGGWLK
jgi:hypothetical protein